jgi:hypothetical protein
MQRQQALARRQQGWAQRQQAWADPRQGSAASRWPRCCGLPPPACLRRRSVPGPSPMRPTSGACCCHCRAHGLLRCACAMNFWVVPPRGRGRKSGFRHREFLSSPPLLNPRSAPGGPSPACLPACSMLGSGSCGPVCPYGHIHQQEATIPEKKGVVHRVTSTTLGGCSSALYSALPKGHWGPLWPGDLHHTPSALPPESPLPAITPGPPGDPWGPCTHRRVPQPADRGCM